MKNLLISNLSKDRPFHFCEGGGQWAKANPYKAFAEEKKCIACTAKQSKQKIFMIEANFPALPSKLKWSIQTIKVLVFQTSLFQCFHRDVKTCIVTVTQFYWTIRILISNKTLVDCAFMIFST